MRKAAVSEVEKIHSMYEGGLKKSEIAREVGRSYKTVLRILGSDKETALRNAYHPPAPPSFEEYEFKYYELPPPDSPRCKCGCGEGAEPQRSFNGKILGYKVYREGHHKRPPLCKCGCGKPVSSRQPKNGSVTYRTYKDGHRPGAILNGKKHCQRCDQIKQLSQFNKHRSGVKSLCKSCQTKKAKEDRIKKYGITTSTYNQLMAKQNGVCACCLKAPAIAIDHDHETGQVRGVLCTRCNTGIGQLGDTLEGVIRAAQYLANIDADEADK